MLPVAEIERAIEAAGMPYRGRDLGVDPAFYRRAVAHAHEIRDRYCFLDLAAQAGRLEAFAAGGRMKPEKAETAAALAAGKAGPRSSPCSSLPDEDEQRRTRIAWLYYVEGKTQSRDRRGSALSRVKVNRELAIGRDSGLVQIRINGRLACCVALERKLEPAIGLAEAVVVPTPAGSRGHRPSLWAWRWAPMSPTG